ncbi:unnamed protein product [Paramecium sonneborni]|uniref:Uncharacterized protein n=1 Tax=Paramecium sonneborni TaxID=65129 RepID=A0A8S1M1E4_9CILI|nr:unnamed protein product [Paramecium sonneborni]
MRFNIQLNVCKTQIRTTNQQDPNKISNISICRILKVSRDFFKIDRGYGNFFHIIYKSHYILRFDLKSLQLGSEFVFELGTFLQTNLLFLITLDQNTFVKIKEKAKYLKNIKQESHQLYLLYYANHKKTLLNLVISISIFQSSLNNQQIIKQIQIFYVFSSLQYKKNLQSSEDSADPSQIELVKQLYSNLKENTQDNYKEFTHQMLLLFLLLIIRKEIIIVILRRLSKFR